MVHLKVHLTSDCVKSSSHSMAGLRKTRVLDLRDANEDADRAIGQLVGREAGIEERLVRRVEQ